MGADYFFRMGSTHAICQDYAIAGVHESGRAYAMVSDGCSGEAIPGQPGSPFTDYGSRLLIRSAWMQRVNILAGDFDPKLIAEISRASAAVLGLPRRALDATLLVAYETPDPCAVPWARANTRVTVRQTGDGVVAARLRKSGDLICYTTSFDNNMPFYLSYLLDPEGLKRYYVECREKTLTGYGRTGDKWEELSVVPMATDRAEVTQEFSFDKNDYDLVLIMSDGAESFQRGSESVPLTEVIDQLFLMKNYEGEFLTRRCSRFLQKFCAENGWKHSDDFSVAGIYLPAPETSAV